MRGTESEEDFNTFVEAIAGFPPAPRAKMSAQDVYLHSYNLLKGLAAKDSPPFPRSRAWQAYAMALSVSEGWTLPGANPDPEQRVREALALAESAKDLDPTDYDLWWALANIQLILGYFDSSSFAEAKKSFAKAVDLNQDERNPNLFAEYADALVHLGEHEKAEKFIRKALNKPDWHPWIRAWVYFMKSGRTENARMVLLEHALDTIKKTRAQFGDPTYLLEMQLLLAAIHMRMAMQLTEPKASLHRDAVRRAMQQFQAFFSYWNEEQTKRFAPFDKGEDKQYWSETIEEVWKIKNTPLEN